MQTSSKINFLCREFLEVCGIVTFHHIFLVDRQVFHVTFSTKGRHIKTEIIHFSETKRYLHVDCNKINIRCLNKLRHLLQVCMTRSPSILQNGHTNWRIFFNLIFVVPSNMIYSSEISPTRCNNCVFILRNGFTLHVSGDSLTHHQEYICCIWPQVSRLT